jgi:hypothetical protein
MEMMGNHIHSVMNPVPTLEEEKGDDGNHIHSVMNPVPTLEEEKGNDGNHIHTVMWFPIISLFIFQCRNFIHY